MQLNIYYVAILSLVLSAVFNRLILFITKNYSDVLQAMDKKAKQTRG